MPSRSPGKAALHRRAPAHRRQRLTGLVGQRPLLPLRFRYVYPNRSRLQRGRVEDTCDAILADIDNHMGSIFEQVCRDWAGRFSADPQLAGAEEIGAYWTRTHDVEVDLVARGRKGIVAVGSCKWSRRADTHDLDRLIELRGQIRNAGSANPYVFARDFHKSLVERTRARRRTPRIGRRAVRRAPKSQMTSRGRRAPRYETPGTKLGDTNKRFQNKLLRLIAEHDIGPDGVQRLQTVMASPYALRS
jgi:hypothetical protein